MLPRLLLLLVMLPAAGLTQVTDYGSVKLLRGWQMADGSYQAALEFDLNPGWKTYWRNPGPAGLPPIFNWAGSDNIGEISFAWPVPDVTKQGGMTTLGYSDYFVLPIRITPAEAGPVRIALSLQFGVCSDICIPAQAVFLSRLNEASDEGVAQIEAALLQVPQTAEAAGLARISCAVRPNGNWYEITAELAFAEAIEAPYVVIEYAQREIWIDMAETSSEGGDIRASAPMKYYGEGVMEMDRTELIISVFGADRAVEIQGCPS